MRKRITLALASGTLALLAVSVLGEAALRARAASKDAPPTRLSEELGWTSREHWTTTREVLDAAGLRHSVQIRTDAHGARRAGEAAKTLLIVGDSYTHALAAGDDSTYYATLADRLGWQVVAHGVEGYGSLQEAMTLERALARQRPDALLWQLCTNDLLNNAFALEGASRVNNNGMRRPYLEASGAIVYRTPKPWPRIRNFANRHSHLLRFLLHALDRRSAAAPPTRSDIEAEIAASRGNLPAYREAGLRTREIFARAGRRLDSIPAFAFSVDAGEPYRGTLEGAAAAAGFEILHGVPEALAAAEAKGVVTRSHDGYHWSEAGHRIVGVHLARELKRRGVGAADPEGNSR